MLGLLAENSLWFFSRSWLFQLHFPQPFSNMKRRDMNCESDFDLWITGHFFTCDVLWFGNYWIFLILFFTCEVLWFLNYWTFLPFYLWFVFCELLDNLTCELYHAVWITGHFCLRFALCFMNYWPFLPNKNVLFYMLFLKIGAHSPL